MESQLLIIKTDSKQNQHYTPNINILNFIVFQTTQIFTKRFIKFISINNFDLKFVAKSVYFNELASEICSYSKTQSFEIRAKVLHVDILFN